MIWMDVDATLAEVPITYTAIIDDTDFKTREDGLTYNQAGLDLVWNFITTAGAQTQTAVTPTTGGGDYDWTNQGNGQYSIGIPASGGASINNDTEGFGWFSGFATGVLPWSGPIIGFRASGTNDKLIDSAYSATRGLSGTALPDAAADAAGGLPISDAGGLDLDAQIGTDIDAILVDTNSLNDTKIPQTLNLTASGNIGIDWANVENPTTAVDLSATDIQLCDTTTDITNQVDANITQITGNSAAAANLRSSCDNYSATRGLAGTALPAAAADAAGGIPISDAGGLDLDAYVKRYNINCETNVFASIDQADTVSILVSMHLWTSRGSIPTAAEITPGTVTIYRKAIGGTSFVTIVNGAACSEADGIIYYQEIFDSLTGYAEGDSILVRFKGQAVVIDGITYAISDSTWGIYRYGEIRQTMRGTDAANILAEVVDDATKIDASALNALTAKTPSKDYLTGTNNADGDIEADEMTGNISATLSAETITAIADEVSTDSFGTVIKKYLVAFINAFK